MPAAGRLPSGRAGTSAAPTALGERPAPAARPRSRRSAARGPTRRCAASLAPSRPAPPSLPAARTGKRGAAPRGFARHRRGCPERSALRAGAPSPRKAGRAGPADGAGVHGRSARLGPVVAINPRISVQSRHRLLNIQLPPRPSASHMASLAAGLKGEGCPLTLAPALLERGGSLSSTSRSAPRVSGFPALQHSHRCAICWKIFVSFWAGLDQGRLSEAKVVQNLALV